MPKITFDQVAKSYGSVEVLPPFDLALDDGEFTVLVGPSGCGKSTTLRMLAGLETLSGGEIFFDEKPISKLEPKDRDLAMVFQDYALYPHMTIAKNMSFALRLARAPKSEIEEKVRRVAEMLNIAPLLDRKPAELSGGQRQRVAMGRALVRDAGTFLFDEPLSNLDAKLRGKMRAELAEMRDTIDKNMVYVTHDQVEAMTLGDRIVVMSDGLIQQQGTPEELFKSPVNKFVAGFIGSPSMNFIDGELVDDDGKTWVHGDGFKLPLDLDISARMNDVQTRAVTVGLRPSSLTTDISRGAPIELKVVVSEYLGAQSVLVTRCGGADVLVETQSTSPVRAGSVQTFGVLTNEIMIFDKASGLRL
ncbi:carbohydrate ABC transporter ATP-binding protein (CUT1 family) [Litoreibacter meonggei]|uniref:Carbohydrate ABC transporter ATP-binding protein (CUT1 family) n=1 Tax=Litoreibacter meonggei TaxID=1049199 RepID=A0A497WQT6_9RHOB|nr:ATP-binding cassette domain-containing protein [Litoreibacter meonggei]RLJ58932.1 carbohydrate ABC transporter ATP-binding protein (CUT1 family) [Litoreibacter meonggei]